jgi:UDP-N-acetylglucosamine--dolichyl-phosphate N-acetylglucosaminephosphotransferase
MIWEVSLGLAALAFSVGTISLCSKGLLAVHEALAFLLGNVLLYFFNKYILAIYKELVLARGIIGMDINKRGTPAGEIKIPESCGVPCAVAYMMFLTISIPFFKYTGNKEMESLLTTAAFSVILCCFLGFMDDVLDLKWRYKIVFPMVASLPLLVNYPGTTQIVVPLPVRGILGKTVNIGFLYYIYASMLSIFCMNSINIYAGINGLEVGQSLIIGVGVVFINVIEIFNPASTDIHIRNQYLSLYLVIPFITVSLCLLYFNKYPSLVFVGDTFCYFAGTVFASASILGHFSKTLLLMFLPQILNFVFSIPQLLGWKPCPRHRLAKFNKETGLLETTWPGNNNLLNYAIHVLGPTSEKVLADKLILFQVS